MQVFVGPPLLVCARDSAKRERLFTAPAASERPAVVQIQDGCVSLLRLGHGVLPIPDACIAHSRLLQDLLSSSDQNTESSLPVTEDSFLAWMGVINGACSDEVLMNRTVALPINSKVDVLVVCAQSLTTKYLCLLCSFGMYVLRKSFCVRMDACCACRCI